MKREPLTARQDQVLSILVAFIRTYHYQPTFAELARLCDVVSVQKVIERIASKGWITFTGSPRAINIPDDVFDSIPWQYETDDPEDRRPRKETLCQRKQSSNRKNS